MIQIGAFEIFSSNLINKLKIDTFNEDYINAVEDIDLSYRILRNNYNLKTINYNIHPMTGSVLGNNMGREARSLLGRLYLFLIITKEID